MRRGTIRAANFARPVRLLGAARLAPAGPPLRAFAATAACSRAAPARPSLAARDRPQMRHRRSDQAGAASAIRSFIYFGLSSPIQNRPNRRR